MTRAAADRPCERRALLGGGGGGGGAGPARSARGPAGASAALYAPLRAPRARAMAIDRRREAAGGGPGRLPPAAEENGALPPGDAAASAPLGGRAGPGGGGDIQPLPAPHAAGGPHPSLLLLDYDGSVLPFLGGLGGGYQKTLVLLTWIPALFIGFSQFSDSFLLDQPNFWCRGAGKGAESAGVTATGRWGGGDLANGTSPPTTLFPTAAWGTAGPLGNGSGADGGEAPPLPSPPDKGDNASNCDCHAWDYGIRTGLVQNVVSKVRAATAPARVPLPSERCALRGPRALPRALCRRGPAVVRARVSTASRGLALLASPRQRCGPGCAAGLPQPSAVTLPPDSKGHPNSRPRWHTRKGRLSLCEGASFPPLPWSCHFVRAGTARGGREADL